MYQIAYRDEKQRGLITSAAWRNFWRKAESSSADRIRQLIATTQGKQGLQVACS
jgi:hypothetical protein